MNQYIEFEIRLHGGKPGGGASGGDGAMYQGDGSELPDIGGMVPIEKVDT